MLKKEALREKYFFLIKRHSQFIEEGLGNVYSLEGGLDEVKEMCERKYLVFEDKLEDILIYKYKKRFEIFSFFSGYLEKTIFHY